MGLAGLFRNDRHGLDLQHDFRAIQGLDLDKGAGGRGCRVDVLIANLAQRREISCHIADVEVELYHVLEGRTSRREPRLRAGKGRNISML